MLVIINMIAIKSVIENTDIITIGKVIGIILFLLFVYLSTRLYFTIQEIKNNWGKYKCKFPYSAFGGYLSPNGIKGEGVNKDKVYYGIEGSKIHYNRCNKKLYDTLSATISAPIYAIFGDGVDKMKTHKKNMSVLSELATDIKGSVIKLIKKFIKIFLVVYYVFMYVFQKLKLILMKVQGVVDIILDSFKTFLLFVNYFIFTIIPLYVQFSIAAVTIGISYLLWGVVYVTGSGVYVSEEILISIFSTLLGTSGPGAIAVLSTAAAAGYGAYLALLWLLSDAKDLIQYTTIFNGIGKLPFFPDEGTTYDSYPDKIVTGEQHDSAGSILNILTVLTVALSDENDTSKCLTKKTLMRILDKEENTIHKPVNKVNLGDYQEDKSMIVGMVEFESSPSIIYSYQGVEMTGSHYILYDKKWEQCSKIGLLDYPYYSKLYCPITSSGKILCVGYTNVVLADYNDGRSYSEWNYEYDKKENNNCMYTEKDYEKHNYPALFVDKEILDTNEKIATVKHIYTPRIQMYNYNNIILSGNVVVREGDTWKRIWQTNATPVKYTLDILYNVITKKHKIEHKGYEFKDFEEK